MNRLLLIFLLSLTATAELVLEITQSAKQPIKVAVLQKDANTAIGEDIINVIRTNIARNILCNAKKTILQVVFIII